MPRKSAMAPGTPCKNIKGAMGEYRCRRNEPGWSRKRSRVSQTMTIIAAYRMNIRYLVGMRRFRGPVVVAGVAMAPPLFLKLCKGPAQVGSDDICTRRL